MLPMQPERRATNISMVTPAPARARPVPPRDRPPFHFRPRAPLRAVRARDRQRRAWSTINVAAFVKKYTTWTLTATTVLSRKKIQTRKVSIAIAPRHTHTHTLLTRCVSLLAQAKHAAFAAKRNQHYGNEAEAMKVAAALAAQDPEEEDDEEHALPALPNGTA